MIVKSFETHPEHEDRMVYGGRYDDWRDHQAPRFGATICLSDLTIEEVRKLDAMLRRFAAGDVGVPATSVEPTQPELLPPVVRVLPEGRR